MRIERLEENIKVYDFKMKEEEYAAITELSVGARYYNPKNDDQVDWQHLPYFD